MILIRLYSALLIAMMCPGSECSTSPVRSSFIDLSSTGRSAAAAAHDFCKNFEAARLLEGVNLELESLVSGADPCISDLRGGSSGVLRFAILMPFEYFELRFIEPVFRTTIVRVF